MINTALVSFGMSGKVFHAPFIASNPHFTLVGSWERSSKNIETAKLIISTYNKANNTNHLLSDVVKFSKDRPGHDKKYWISSEKLEKIIKHSYTSLEQGIAEVVKQHEKYSRVSQ
jgi:dTDP-D-glucose 4,6-dehydratase